MTPSDPSSRHFTPFTLATLLVTCLAGCPGSPGDPSVGDPWINTTGEQEVTTGSTGGVDETGADETGAAEGGGGGPPLACSMPSMFGEYDFDDNADRYPASGVMHAVDICNFPELVGAPAPGSPILSNDTAPSDETSSFTVHVYHPMDPLDPGEWPEAPPMASMFLIPGAGLSVVENEGQPFAEDHTYAELIERTVQAGIIVFAIEPESSQGPWNSGVRRSALACAMLWAKDPNGWNQGDNAGRLDDNVIIAGQSRGASGAWLLTSDLLGGTNLPSATSLDDYEQCGTVAIAQRFGPANSGDPVATDIPITLEHAPPLLTLLGAIDNDTHGDAVAAFDQFVPEETILFANDEQHMPLADSVRVDVYGATHKAFGGATPAISPVFAGLDQARAAGSFYLEQWIRWHVFDEMDARDWVLAPTKPVVTDAEFPSSDPDLTDPALWAETELAAFYAEVERPLIHVDYTPGLDPDANDGAERFVIDTMTRAQAECDAQLSDSTYGSAVTASAEATTEVCVGPASSLLAGISATAFDAHATDAMRVSWGQGSAGTAEVEWMLTKGGNPLEQVSDFTHLTFRIANVLEDDDGSCDDSFDSFDVTVELESQSPGGTVSRSVTVESLLDREQRSIDPDGVAVCPGECCGHQAMHTVRIPLFESFCDIDPMDPQPPIAIDYLSAVRLKLPLDTDRHVLVDSLEFTKDPTAANTDTCPAYEAAWDCEATFDLVATETSCASEPAPSGCAAGNVVQNQVALPEVDAGLPGAFSGWVVHTPAGWTDPVNPTADQLDLVRDLCVSACELEWSDNPDVSATCAAGNFATPTVRQVPDIGPQRRIHPDYLHGEGMFGAQVLTSNLQEDACHAFDEALCGATPLRATSATTALRRGEEVRVQLGGSLTNVTFTTPGDSVSLPMTGEAGYSHCPAGITGTTCPFYLGSLQASATTSVAVTDTCPDSSGFSAVVTDFDLQLLQPAFGIADDSSLFKAFPPGALFVEGYITVNGDSYTVRSVNTDPVYMQAATSGVFAADIPIDLAAIGLELPCGGGTIPVSLEIDLRSNAALERPPSITIATPTSVSCKGGQVPLAHTGSDPDSDLATVRWYVDDVLLAPGVTSIPFNGPHELRAVAYDQRGAATTATVSVGCS